MQKIGSNTPLRARKSDWADPWQRVNLRAVGQDILLDTTRSVKVQEAEATYLKDRAGGRTDDIDIVCEKG